MKSLLPVSVLCLVGLAWSPGAAASQITLRYVAIGEQGAAQALAADKAGNLFTVSRIMDVAGRTLIRVDKLDSKGNAIASFDFGGLGFQQPAAAATDAQGNLIIVGTADSTEFPLVSPLFSSVSGRSAFITKVDSQLHGILFSTLLSKDSSANAVTVDAVGNIYVVGSGLSATFPITAGAYHTQSPGAFVVEVSPDGDRLLLSTQFGGSQVNCLGSSCVDVSAGTTATAVAIDSSGAILFAGSTNTEDLPVTPGVLGHSCNCPNNGGAGFVAKLSPGGGRLEWSTFLNSTAALQSQFLEIHALALDAAGNVLVGGGTPGIQTTPNTVQPAPLAGQQFEGFIAKLNVSATNLIWSTYLGGNQSGSGLFARVSGLAVHPDGQIAITGYSDPRLLPVFPGVTNLGNTYSAWLSAAGSALQELFIGPDNSTGQALVLTPGNFATIGKSGSLWIEGPGAGPSLLATASAAGGPVSGLVAPDELISLYGIKIGPRNALSGQILNGAFTSSLGDYTLLFDGIPAPILYLGPTQINTIVPHEIAGQDSTHLQIVTPTETIDGPTLVIRQAQPYAFQNSATNLTAALNQDGSINSRQNPAKPGSTVTIFATGGGAVDWNNGEIVPTNLFRGAHLPVSVLALVFGGPNSVGGLTSLEVVYAGDAPGLVAGVMQINFRLPDSLALLPTFSFQLEVGNILGGGGTIAVAP